MVGFDDFLTGHVPGVPKVGMARTDHLSHMTRQDAWSYQVVRPQGRRRRIPAQSATGLVAWSRRASFTRKPAAGTAVGGTYRRPSWAASGR